jgi:hypothetical protein
MSKLGRARGAATCASCRRFDGHAWCRRWNYHTEAGAPICAEFRAVAPRDA